MSDYLLKGLTRKNPPQMPSGDPKMPSKSVDTKDDGGPGRMQTASTPKTLGGRTA